jgi:2-polyprenyl-3-methyl-5-hydroxy-6-metoxy-1,4-benzoquinol methylase
MRFWYTKTPDDAHSSPMRSYLDAFMKDELPKLCTPRKLSVFDIGCGTAYMRSVLAHDGYSGGYTGVDVVREPKFDMHAEPAFVTEFLQEDITRFSSDKRFDLVISNTALEHIQDDAAAVRVAHALCAKGGMEVHIVPSLWSLPLYLWHGYRQYTPTRIRKLFSGTNYRVYRMGGLGSFFFHFFWITVPERLFGMTPFRTRHPGAYVRMKRFANRIDYLLPLFSTLYAIVVFC